MIADTRRALGRPSWKPLLEKPLTPGPEGARDAAIMQGLPRNRTPSPFHHRTGTPPDNPFVGKRRLPRGTGSSRPCPAQHAIIPRPKVPPLYPPNESAMPTQRTREALAALRMALGGDGATCPTEEGLLARIGPVHPFVLQPQHAGLPSYGPPLASTESPGAAGAAAAAGEGDEGDEQDEEERLPWLRSMHGLTRGSSVWPLGQGMLSRSALIVAATLWKASRGRVPPRVPGHQRESWDARVEEVATSTRLGTKTVSRALGMLYPLCEVHPSELRADRFTRGPPGQEAAPGPLTFQHSYRSRCCEWRRKLCCLRERSKPKQPHRVHLPYLQVSLGARGVGETPWEQGDDAYEESDTGGEGGGDPTHGVGAGGTTSSDGGQAAAAAAAAAGGGDDGETTGHDEDREGTDREGEEEEEEEEEEPAGEVRLVHVSDTGHRLMCWSARGPPPKGKVCGHKCHNPLCTNPQHTVWLTPRQNQARVGHATRQAYEAAEAASPLELWALAGVSPPTWTHAPGHGEEEDEEDAQQGNATDADEDEDASLGKDRQQRKKRARRG